MIALELLDELNEFLRFIVYSYQLQTQGGILKPPQTVTGFLPPKGETDEPDYPFVISRLLSGEDNDEQGNVTVKILVGTYAEDAQGFRDSLNLVEHIRQNLFKKRIIAKKFRIEYPFKWEQPEEQPYPYWMAEMTTVWTVPRPIEEVYCGEEDDIYGTNWTGAAGVLRP